ncbi:MAG: hypothetical protein K0R49_1484, partial [Burkholderiales bacterium]|nr:hypothetical protein [Burkholderiales bacterium]
SQCSVSGTENSSRLIWNDGSNISFTESIEGDLEGNPLKLKTVFNINFVSN